MTGSYVLYFPKCPFNLLLVSQLTSSNDCLITFTKATVILQTRVWEGLLVSDMGLNAFTNYPPYPVFVLP